MNPNLEETLKGLEFAAQRSEDAALAAETIAAKFRPEFEACWEPPLTIDSSGTLVKGDRAGELRFYVLDNEHQAKSLRKEATVFRAAIQLLQLLTKSENP